MVSFTVLPTAPRFPSASKGAHSRRCTGSVSACQTFSGEWRSSRTRTSVHLSPCFCTCAPLAGPGAYGSRSVILFSHPLVQPNLNGAPRLQVMRSCFPSARSLQLIPSASRHTPGGCSFSGSDPMRRTLPSRSSICISSAHSKLFGDSGFLRRTRCTACAVHAHPRSLSKPTYGAGSGCRW